MNLGYLFLLLPENYQICKSDQIRSANYQMEAFERAILLLVVMTNLQACQDHKLPHMRTS